MTPASDSVRPREWVLVCLVAAVAALVAAVSARPYAGSWNDGSRLASVESLVERGTSPSILRLSERAVGGRSRRAQPLRPGSAGAAVRHGDRILVNGYYYSHKSPVPSVLMAVLYAGLRQGAGTRPPRSVRVVHVSVRRGRPMSCGRGDLPARRHPRPPGEDAIAARGRSRLRNDGRSTTHGRSTITSCCWRSSSGCCCSSRTSCGDAIHGPARGAGHSRGSRLRRRDGSGAAAAAVPSASWRSTAGLCGRSRCSASPLCPGSVCTTRSTTASAAPRSGGVGSGILPLARQPLR
jgi:hypothetical protein